MRSWRISIVRATTALVLLPGFLAGCPGPAPEPEPEPAREREVVEAPNDGLVATLQAEPRGDTVYLSLRVTNPGDAPIEMTFATGQTYDFVVERGEAEVWRWSEDRMFTQVIRHESIEGGATEVYEAEWAPATGTTGTFRVRGILTAREDRLEQQTQIQLP